MKPLSICILLLFLPMLMIARSPFRTCDPKKPYIITRWAAESPSLCKIAVDTDNAFSCTYFQERVSNQTKPLTQCTFKSCSDKKEYVLRSYYLEQEPVFKTFDYAYFMSKIIPDGPIEYLDDPSKSVSGKELKKLAQEVLGEIHEYKKNYKEFTLLKRNNFNPCTCSGVVILKYKKYPFILKIFMETPESFVRPFSKGWQTAGVFMMGGGMNRYLSGFTRVKNLEVINKMIKKHPKFSKEITQAHRKWFMLPDGVQWFEVIGHNIGPCGEQYTKLPHIYCVICDEHEGRPMSIFNRDDCRYAIEVTHYLKNRLDPNITNLMEKKSKKTDQEKDNTKEKSQKSAKTRAAANAKKRNEIVIIDTEHCPTMLGLRDTVAFNNYISWYLKLTYKAVMDVFFRTKSYNYKCQQNPLKVLSLHDDELEDVDEANETNDTQGSQAAL